MHYALQTGHRRQEFFEAAHHRLENAYLDLHLLAYRGDVEGITTRTFEIFNDAAMEVFTRTPYFTEDHKQHVERISELLAYR
eukprot:692448-Pyramimonas_sp.AAC.1